MIKKYKIPIIIACVLLLLYFYNHTFTSTRWRESPNQRYKIVDSLTRWHHLAGMTEAEIMELLGPPDSTQGSFKIDHRKFQPGQALIYKMGVVYVDVTYLILPIQDGVCTEVLIDVT